MSILEYNGGCCVAMSGKNCFAIASDMGMINQGKNISQNTPKVHRIHDRLFVGLTGLATDRQTVLDRLMFRSKQYHLHEERLIDPVPFSNVLSTMLYERRFGPWFVEPIVAGFNPDNSVFLCNTDLLGAKCLPIDFVCAGTCEESLMGMCEALWKPDLNSEEIFEVISQALLTALDRDCISGWGATVTIVTPEAIITRLLRTRGD